MVEGSDRLEIPKSHRRFYQEEWVYSKGKWYHVDNKGYMQQGWTAVNDSWFYLVPETGEMKTGWIQQDGSWYYLSEDGRMAVNVTTPDGYQVGSDGKLV